MRYMLWGTGGAAERFLKEYLLCFYVDGEIVAVVDSDPKKKGKFFLGQKIILPEDMKDISYDKLVICSSFSEEILSQIREMGISTENAVTIAEIKKEFVDIYVSQCGLCQKKVLILGDQKQYSHMSQFYKGYLKEIAFLSLGKLERLGQISYDYILLSELYNTEYNPQGESELTLEANVISELTDKYGIERNRILPSVVFQLLYRIYERSVSYGANHTDKTFLEIRLTGPAGWGYIFEVVSKNIFYASQMGYIPVVNMMSDWNLYLEEDEVGKVNAWDKFFEQPAGYGMDDLLKSKYVLIAPQEQPKKYYNRDFYKKLVMKPRLKEMFQSYMEVFQARGRALGVLFRGTDYANLKPYNHFVQPSLEMMLEAVEEKWKEWGGFDSIYLCTEVEEATQAFTDRFGDKVFYYPQIRYSEQYSDYLGNQRFQRKEDAFYRGADYWILLNALAKCDSLVAGNCGGTSTVLHMNRGAYKNRYIFDLGRYGSGKSNTPLQSNGV